MKERLFESYLHTTIIGVDINSKMQFTAKEEVLLKRTNDFGLQKLITKCVLINNMLIKIQVLCTHCHMLSISDLFPVVRMFLNSRLDLLLRQ